ncbi:hypothetical protein PHYC_01584 [Phycisphaerales bacterium]|nr:hypothetical protein PHYC_01584 [Phycisphaerales bacterium]
MNTTLKAGMMTAMLAAAMAGTAMAQTEVEPNNSIGTAGAPTGVPCTRSGVISPTNDNDYFAITVPQGTSLRILATPTSHTCNTSDLLLTFFNAAGGVVAMDDDGAVMFCPKLDPAVYPAMANLAAGTYYISVININGASNVAYTLTVELVFLASPLNPAFTYQGVLKENEAPVVGPRDFTVSLWNHPTSPNTDNRVGTPIYLNSVDVSNGLFALPLNFGSDAFNGEERFMEIQVANSGQGPGGTVLGPRQRLTVAPHAAYALKAAAANTAATADFATTANNAGTANQANFCSVADSAWAVPWTGITGMPSGFVDGQDNAGPWSLNGFTAYYTAGAVGIGTTSASGFTFAVNGSAAKTGGGSWSVFCDSRLKHDIKPLSGTLDRLLGLRGYTFEYNNEAVEKRMAMPGTQIGLIAEEVERVFPDWVEKDADGYRYVTERATTALMVEALRDLRAEKDTALAEKQAQIDALKAGNEALEARLRRLEESLSR